MTSQVYQDVLVGMAEIYQVFVTLSLTITDSQNPQIHMSGDAEICPSSRGDVQVSCLEQQTARYWFFQGQADGAANWGLLSRQNKLHQIPAWQVVPPILPTDYEENTPSSHTCRHTHNAHSLPSSIQRFSRRANWT